MTEEMDATTKNAFLDFVRPLFPLINDYLASVTTPWPEAAYRVSNLGELASELAIDPLPDSPQ